MELKLIKEKEMALLSRKRYTFHMAYKGPVPARLLIKKAVAKQLKADENLVVIRHIYPVFGIEEARVVTAVYDSPDAMKRLETKNTLEKHSEKPKEDKPAEEKKEAS